MKKDPAPKPQPKEPKDKKPRTPKVDYEGSRWSAFILLTLTIIVSLILYLTGNR